MEGPPLLSSIIMVWGVVGSICFLLVKSELPRNEFRRFDPSQPNFYSPPPPLLSPPPPSPPPPSPPPPSPPPPYTTPPPSSPPPPSSSPPPLPKPRRPPPPPLKSAKGPKNKTNASRPPPKNTNYRSVEPDGKKNKGKVIGLWFAGAAGVLQLGVIGFLVYKKREISKITDRHDSFS